MVKVKACDAPAEDGRSALPRPITPTMADMLHRLVATHPAGQITTASAAAALRLDPTTAYHHLHHLAARGWLDSTETGLWLLNPPARLLEHMPAILDAAPAMLELMCEMCETHERARVCLLHLSGSTGNGCFSMHPSG